MGGELENWGWRILRIGAFLKFSRGREGSGNEHQFYKIFHATGG